MRSVRALFAFLVLTAVLAAGAPQPAAAADPGLAALAPKMAAALIADDVATLRAACAANATVVDEFAPYSWSGSDACVRWAAGFAAFAKQLGLTGFKATVAPKPFTDVTKKNAYVTARVTFDAMLKGKPISEAGTWTFVVVKDGTGWKITSMAWGTLHH